MTPSTPIFSTFCWAWARPANTPPVRAATSSPSASHPAALCNVVIGPSWRPAFERDGALSLRVPAPCRYDSVVYNAIGFCVHNLPRNADGAERHDRPRRIMGREGAPGAGAPAARAPRRPRASRPRPPRPARGRPPLRRVPPPPRAHRGQSGPDVVLARARGADVADHGGLRKTGLVVLRLRRAPGPARSRARGRARAGRRRSHDPPPAADRRPAESRPDAEDTGRPSRRVRQAAEERPGVMKIKVINPNTTESMTEKLGAAARGVAAEGTTLAAGRPARG